MKERNLIEMRNQIQTLGAVLQQITQEIAFLKDLAIGNHELSKLLPGYEDAVEQLKKRVEDEKTEKGS